MHFLYIFCCCFVGIVVVLPFLNVNLCCLCCVDWMQDVILSSRDPCTYAHTRQCTEQVIGFEHDLHLLHIQLHLLCSSWRFNIPRSATKLQKNVGCQLPTLSNTNKLLQMRKQMQHDLDPFTWIVWLWTHNKQKAGAKQRQPFFFFSFFWLCWRRHSQNPQHLQCNDFYCKQ